MEAGVGIDTKPVPRRKKERAVGQGRKERKINFNKGRKKEQEE